MSPPPATPTPRRFFLPKRATQSSQTPTAPTAPQFQSTPRFGSSVPRPTQTLRDRHVEDVEEEEEDRVEESSVEEEHDARNDNLQDSIDTESDASVDEDGVLMSSPFGTQPDTLHSPHHGQSARIGSLRGPLSPGGREAKRRKMSISPAPDSSPSRQPTAGLHTTHHNDSMSDQGSYDEEQSSGADEDHSLAEDAAQARAPQQPVFQPAPRFKPVDTGPAAEGLPAAFSPQRRGARYVAGGLAAELQGWLSDVKGWGGSDERTAGDSAGRIVVGEVRPGGRMSLVRSRTAPGEEARRLILAGEGRLTGLGRPVVVEVGTVVAVGRPVWDVTLDGELWTVACDWSVV